MTGRTASRSVTLATDDDDQLGPPLVQRRVDAPLLDGPDLVAGERRSSRSGPWSEPGAVPSGVERQEQRRRARGGAAGVRARQERRARRRRPVSRHRDKLSRS